MLRRVEGNYVAGCQGRRESRRDRTEIGVVGVDAVARVYGIGAHGRQAFLIAFPCASRFRELIGDGLANCVGGRRDGLNSVNVVDTGRPAGLIGSVDRNHRGIRPRAGDRANIRGRGGVGVGGPGREVGGAVEVVPIRRIVAQYAEVRTAHHLEIIGQTRMSDGEVVGCRIRKTNKVVDVWQVWVVHHLAVAVILHHDHPYVVQIRDTCRNRTLRGERASPRHNRQKAHKHSSHFHLDSPFPQKYSDEAAKCWR